MKVRNEWFQCPFCPMETDVGIPVRIKIKNSEEVIKGLICEDCYKEKKHLKQEVVKYD